MIIQNQVKIGKNTIINTGSIIEHDCNIGKNCFISPGCVLCGNVKIGDNVYLGPNTCVISNQTIGSNTVIAAGSTITKNISSNKFYYEKKNNRKKNMKCYAFIFARKGSKRLKNKNLKILNKKPLISYSIDLSKKIKNISKVFVSTNDPKIKKIALKKKCIIINRPNHLCSSSSPEWLSWQHAIRFVKKNLIANLIF